MRDVLGGLTTRGRCFLSGGLTCVLAGLLLGQRDVLRVGVLLVVLPLAAAVALRRTRYRLTCTRSLAPSRVPVGADAEVVLRVDNVSRLPTEVLAMEDTACYELGGRPRFTLDRVPAGTGRSVSYAVRSEVRGRYPVGPLAVRLTDPFGLVELTRSFAAVDELVVTPPVSPLPPVRGGGRWSGTGANTASSLAAVGEDDLTVRTYRLGDDLRKVHWKATAHAGQMMVRREEQPRQSAAALVLDLRLAAHRGEGQTSSLEWAVAAAASIGVHLARSGYGVRLVGSDGVVSGGGSGSAAAAALLDSLATVGAHRGAGLRPALARIGGAAEGLVVAVLGDLDPAVAREVAGALPRAAAGLAVLLDVTGWTGGRPATRGTGSGSGSLRVEQTARVLRSGGWRPVVARHGDDLAALWSQLVDCEAGGQRASPAGPPAAGSWPPPGPATAAGAGPATPATAGVGR